MPAELIRFIPLNRHGQGSGHMRRCLKTASVLKDRGIIILDETSGDSITRREWEEQIPGFPGDVRISSPETVAGYGSAVGEEASRRGMDADGSTGPGSGFLPALAVFDRRTTTLRDLEPWTDRACPILLDDDGPARRAAPFLIDIIPGPRSSGANVSSPALMDLPPRVRRPDSSGPVLVSFGGQDPAGLTVPVVRALVEKGLYDAGSVTVTLPAGIDPAVLPSGVHVLEAPGGLASLMGGFGLVLCSYGLTAWEALAAGCAVITVDPTPYHAGLSREAGIPGLGCVESPGEGRLPAAADAYLQELLENPAVPAAASEAAAAALETDPAGPRSLADLLGELEAPRPACLACGAPMPPVIARFPRRSYYRCPECGIIGMYRFRLRPDEYGPDYFGREYTSQYGRSYLEDFEAIRGMAHRRLKALSRRSARGGRLLDIGCAFGPFLAAAADAGYRPCGTDVSAEGVAYVRDVLGYPAVNGRFPGDNPAAALGVDAFDVVTLWYVIEHFAVLEPVLDAVNRLLKDGGVLAFSTPSGCGISARKSLRTFLERSPRDHYSIWTPRTARKLLARHGFRVYRIRITGHHPERFPGAPEPGTARYHIAGFISRLFRLGDTFEAYAVKEQPSA